MSFFERLNTIKLRSISIFLVLSLGMSITLKAETLPTVPPAFKPVIIPDLSPMDETNVIYQDRVGIIWIGTESGLLSYDSNAVKLYINDTENVESISSSRITAIAEDEQSMLWVASRNGLNKFDVQKQKFYHYLIRPKSDQEYVNNHVYGVFVDSKNRVWATTATGLYLYNRQSDTFTSFRPWHPEYSFNNLDIWAYSIQEDPQGNIWVGTSAGGIIKFDPDKHHFTHFSSHVNNKNKFPIDFINTIEVESSDQLLVGTELGLFRFNTRTFEASRIAETQIDGPVTELSKDKDGYWWMVVDAELVRLSSDLSKVSKRGIIESQRLSRLQQKVKSLFIDRENNIWTYFKDAGVHFLSSDLSRVKTLDFNEQETFNNFTKINDVFLNGGALWIATNQELSSISSEMKRQVILRNLDEKEATSLGEFYAIHKTQDGEILVGRQHGFSRIKKDASLEHYIHTAKEHTSAIIEDSKKNTWILAGEQGIKIISDALDEHPFYRQQSNIIKDDYAKTKYLFLTPSRQHIAVFYAGFGLYRYSINTEEMTKIDGIDSLDGITHIQQTKQGTLILFNKGVTATEVNIESGILNPRALPKAKIGCLVTALDGTTWYSQLKGDLYRESADGTALDKLRNNEGIPTLGMTGSHCVQTDSGELLFSSYEGLLLVEAAESFTNKAPVNTIISRVLDSKKNITEVHSRDSGNSISKQYALSLKLLYGETPIIFNFSALSYSDAESNQFKYRVKGLNDAWTETSENSATLSYLPVGRFQFEVIGSNGDGRWSDLPAAVSLEILPPLWLTWWAKAIYIILTVIFIYALFRSRTRAIRNRAMHFEEMVNLRTRELAKEKEIVEQLLAKKNDEFANVSHEFRTPLTLILGPIQNLLRSNIRSSTRKKLEMAKRNSYRLLRMVDQLLNMEKFKVQQIMSSQNIAVKPIASLIAQSFKELAKEKEIALHVLKIDDVTVDFSVDAFEKIILNLLSNALKYTKPGGEIRLSIVEYGNKQMQIVVKDTGVGIPGDRLESVFERYNRVLDEHSEKITGAGIGLALVKELVEVHQGTIELESKLGVGSTFTVTLNVTNAAVSNSPTLVNNEMIELELESIRGQELVPVENISPLLIEDDKQVDIEAKITDKKATLLIIEDNPDMREYIIESLSDEYECLQAPNGKLGVAVAIKDIPDLIISDVMMPEMDGYQVSEILKEDEKTSHIPLILLTARGDKESRLKGWRKHADEYLTKPFDSEELNIRVESLLSIRNILRSRFAQEDIENQTPAQLISAGMNEKDQAFIEKINECCEKNYADAEFETVKIAESVFMSERQLQRKLKALVDRSPSDYLRIYRLNKAKVKLLEGGRISNIALDIGFGSQAYFSKCFKAQFGMTAKQYQASKKA